VKELDLNPQQDHPDQAVHWGPFLLSVPRFALHSLM
jgi:hypothetical protein